MDPFPQDWELLALFEGEPHLLDPQVPWFYNRLTFTSLRGDDRIECALEPASRILEFRWYHGDRLHVDLHVEGVRGLRVEMGGGVDALVASFAEGGSLGPLRLQLRPHPRVEWNVNTRCC